MATLFFILVLVDIALIGTGIWLVFRISNKFRDGEGSIATALRLWLEQVRKAYEKTSKN